jgi:hypothetical protein
VRVAIHVRYRLSVKLVHSRVQALAGFVVGLLAFFNTVLHFLQNVISRDDYQRLKRLAEIARQRSVDAQASLEAHIEGQGCGGNGEAAA